MAAFAEVISSYPPHPAPRERELPTCAVCADSMIAAESSALLSDDIISYLWTCETCGYGFVTTHTIQGFLCH